MYRTWLANDFCQPIYEEWFAEAVAKGRIKAHGFFADPLRHKAYCKAAWNGPARGLLNPVQEVNAAVLKVENGFSTRSTETMEMAGGDFYSNCEQLKNEEKALKEVKKIADSTEKRKEDGGGNSQDSRSRKNRTCQNSVGQGSSRKIGNSTKGEQKNKFWDIIPGTEGKPPEILLYGTISRWEDKENDNTVTPKQFSEDFDALGDVPEIVVRINSGGGDVFAANAIFTKLKSSTAKITVKIDGWAASAATIIAMAGDTVQIARNSVFMIHDPSMVVFGSFQAGDFEKMAGELKVVKQSIVNAYWMKTKKDAGDIADLMAEETWLTGDEAVEEGFCDELMFEDAQTVVKDDSKVVVNGVEMDISGFKNFPDALLGIKNEDRGGKKSAGGIHRTEQRNQRSHKHKNTKSQHGKPCWLHSFFGLQDTTL